MSVLVDNSKKNEVGAIIADGSDCYIAVFLYKCSWKMFHWIGNGNDQSTFCHIDSFQDITSIPRDKNKTYLDIKYGGLKKGKCPNAMWRQ